MKIFTSPDKPKQTSRTISDPRQTKQTIKNSKAFPDQEFSSR